VHVEDVGRALRVAVGVSGAAAAAACLILLLAGFHLLVGLAAAALLLPGGLITAGFGASLLVAPAVTASAYGRGTRALALRPRAPAPRHARHRS
jgi:hypothetical protein